MTEHEMAEWWEARPKHARPGDVLDSADLRFMRAAARMLRRVPTRAQKIEALRMAGLAGKSRAHRERAKAAERNQIALRLLGFDDQETP